MNAFERCTIELSPRLKKKGVENHESMARGMCSMWAEENGEEKEFSNNSASETHRSFGMNFEIGEVVQNDSDDQSVVEFPIIAITSGRHDYEIDGDDQKVYIEPEMLKNSVEAFKELPIYVNHQRTPEELIGKAVNPEIEEMDNGKIAVKMLAQVSEQSERAYDMIEKVKEGDVTHVSIDWFSKDVDVMGDAYATNIRPVEVSFIENDVSTPVCDECTIGEGKECDSHDEKEKEHSCSCSNGTTCGCESQEGTEKEVETMAEENKDVKSEAETLLEREFASYKKQLDEVNNTHAELQTKYEEAMNQVAAFQKAEEERQAAEIEARKTALVDNVISKEVLLGRVTEESKETRAAELVAWEENRLTGFSEALEAVPAPEESEKTFGKGKAHESENKPVETEPVVERMFSMKNGRISLNKKALNK
jgi:hypothetical protein|tara:strand:- start:12 stop:1277 length:1266 start_codon:yes stop_codon:yes gene_type:complete